MPKRTEMRPETLKGWKEIAEFLGHPASVAQRWASEGMPVQRQGRFVTRTPEELKTWLGKETGKPVQAATKNTELAAAVKHGISLIRREENPEEQPKKTNRTTA